MTTEEYVPVWHADGWCFMSTIDADRGCGCALNREDDGAVSGAMFRGLQFPAATVPVGHRCMPHREEAGLPLMSRMEGGGVR